MKKLTNLDKLVKTRLIETGMTQRELADKLFVNEATLCRWLKGERSPFLADAVRMLQVLGITYIKVSDLEQ